MQRFVYKAREKNGRSVKGQVEAGDIAEAARLLRERGLFLVSVSRSGYSFFELWGRIANRVGLDDVAVFTRQFATMISAGLPITDALIIVKSQSRPAFVPVVDGILSDVEGGSSLAAAFKRRMDVFSSVYVALIEAGEEGGVLDQIVNRLADNLEAAREFRAKVKGAMIYPVIVIIGMFAVGAIMMIFVVPKLLALFADFNAELPAPTRVLIAISGFATKYWWIVGLMLIGIVWGIVFYGKTRAGREKIDSLKFKLPVFGPLTRQVILAEFTRTLGLLVGAGVSLLQGLRVASGVAGNVVVSGAVSRSAVKVEQGFSLAYAFSQEPEVFPPMLFRLLAVGEETGKVDEALLKVARVFEQDSEHLVRGLTAAVEPLVVVILGIGVVFLAVAVILPIYNLTGQF